METLTLFLSAAMTALAIENAVFARGLGLSRGTMFMNGKKEGIIFGGTFTWLAFANSFFAALANYLLFDNPLNMYIRPVAFLAGSAIVYIGTSFLVDLVLPRRLAASVHEAMPISGINSALYAIFYISALTSLSFIQTVGYSLGTGLGYTAAILIIYFGRKRLAISPVPRSFRGLPILLIYLGLISLAIYGLIGLSLRT